MLHKRYYKAIYQKSSFGDVMVINAIKHHLNRNSLFLSWDAKHFRNISPVKVTAPAEFLKAE